VRFAADSGPLPTVIDPSPFGLCSVMLWSSLLITVQPFGTKTDSLAFDAVPGDVPPPVGVGIGVGVMLLLLVFCPRQHEPLARVGA